MTPPYHLPNKILRDFYYPYVFTDKLEVKVINIPFYTLNQAHFTLRGLFGEHYTKYVKVIRGKRAIRYKYELGPNSVVVEGKKRVVKKFYIPPEYNITRNTRFIFRRKLYQTLKTADQSMIDKFLLKYYNHGYGYERKVKI